MIPGRPHKRPQSGMAFIAGSTDAFAGRRLRRGPPARTKLEPFSEWQGLQNLQVRLVSIQDLFLKEPNETFTSWQERLMYWDGQSIQQ